MKNTLTAKQASEIIGISVQKLYMLRDIMNKAKNPRKPIAIQGKEWDYKEGKTLFSREYVQKIKEWREESKSVKAKANLVTEESVEVMTIINGVATNVTGSRAKRILNLVQKFKTDQEEKAKNNQIQTMVENTIRVSSENAQASTNE